MHTPEPLPFTCLLVCQVPEVPRELALPEFMHTTGRDVRAEQYHNEATPPFFQYMRTKLVGGWVGGGPAGRQGAQHGGTACV